MNLIIPIASHSKFFSLEEYGYPKHLVEVMGIPMIEHVIKNIIQKSNFKKIIFVVKQSECDNYHLDDTLSLLCPTEPIIIKLRSDTQGALCSILLAIEHINTEDPLIIANADQIFDNGIEKYISDFTNSSLDAACLTFRSVHPRWSYVRLDSSDLVIEAAEKRPISRHAIAGIYLYKRGSDFVSAAMATIKNCLNEGIFYISPVFNEYVLRGAKVGHYTIPNNQFHTLYSPQKIEEFELKCRNLKRPKNDGI